MGFLTATRIAGLSLLTACQLTTTSVEPDLPTGRAENTATLACRANGTPIVANNAVTGGTFIGAFFGATLPVTAKLQPDSTLVISATDINNLPAYTPYHLLELKIRRFRGAGTYVPVASSSFQVVTYDAQNRPVDHAAQYPVAGTANRLVITKWNQVAKVLQGTFALQVAGPNNPQTPTKLSDGRFDVDVK